MEVWGTLVVDFGEKYSSGRFLCLPPELVVWIILCFDYSGMCYRVDHLWVYSDFAYL